MVDPKKVKDPNENRPRKVFYLGEDTAYFNDLQARFKRNYEDMVFVFKLFSYKQIEKVEDLHQFYLTLLSEPADILYIDYTIKESEMLYLADLISHEPLFEKTVVVALLDYLAPETLREEVILMGIKLCHFKTGERHDVVYDPMYISDMKRVKDPGFCVAKFADQARLGQVCRMKAVSDTRIDLEGDFGFSPGQEVQLQTCLFDEIIPSLHYVVKEVSNTNLLYDYMASYSLGHVFVDPISAPVEGEKLTRKERLLQSIAFEERESRLKMVKKKLSTWIQAEYNPGLLEKIKVLYIDKKLNYLKQLSMRGDFLPYNVRYKTRLSNLEKDLSIYRPHFIFYQFEYLDIEERILLTPEEAEERRKTHPEDKIIDSGHGEELVTIKTPSNLEEAQRSLDLVNDRNFAALNGDQALIELMTAISQIPNYKPFVVIFNSLHETTATLQARLKYSQIICYPTTFNIKVASTIIEMFDKKRKADALAVKKVMKDSVDAKVIIHSTDLRRSIAEIYHPVTIEAASESHVILRASYEIPVGTVHRLQLNELNMYVTIVPNNEPGKEITNKGLIKGLVHSIGEKDKSELRRFVNSVFFRKQEQEREADMKKFQEINSKARQGKKTAA